MNHTPTFKFLNNASFYVLLATTLLLPFFFLPAVNIPLDASKGFLLSLGVIVSFLFWVVARLVDGRFVVPRHGLLAAVVVFPLVYLLSAAFSEVPDVSLIGSGFALGTFSTTLILSIALFLAAVFFQEKKRISSFYIGLFISFAVIVVFQLLNLFAGLSDSFPAFFTELRAGNVVGGWNDLGVYFGLTAIITLLTIEILPLRGALRWLMYAGLVASLFFLMVINFFPAWIAVGLLSLLIFVYTLSYNPHVSGMKERSERTLPMAAFLVVIISLIFILANDLIGGFLANQFDITNTTVRPSLSSTIEIARSSLAGNPIFGAGANMFSNQWLLFKPLSINLTIFWDTIFTSGFGLLPTFLITTGALGGLAWVSFLLYFIIKGVTSVFSAIKDAVSNYLLISSFIAALYLWIFTLVHVPSLFLYAFAFIMTGVFVGILVAGKDAPQLHFSFLEDPRNSFFSILLLVILLILTIAGGYAVTKKFVSRIQYSVGAQRLSAAQNMEDLVRAERALLQGINTSEEDVYYRTLSNVYLTQLSQTLGDQELSEDEARRRMQSLVSQSEEAALLAVRTDSTSYQNWMNLGGVYRQLISLQVQDAYENAVTAFEQAKDRNPNSPAVELRLAQVELASENTEQARTHINQALELKPNYVDAIFLLAQMEVDAGNTDEAITQAQRAASVAPSNPTVFFQLGILRYNNDDYTQAASAFERAVALSPNFLNARYFLGLTYDQLDDTEDAIAQFEFIAEQSPENEEIQTILSNLRSGQSALSGFDTGGTATPDTELPVEESEEVGTEEGDEAVVDNPDAE